MSGRMRRVIGENGPRNYEGHAGGVACGSRRMPGVQQILETPMSMPDAECCPPASLTSAGSGIRHLALTR
jgi:hypothetical protein